jgi:heptosyltransferase-2
VIDPCPLIDELIDVEGFWSARARLRRERPEAALLLTNSFRTAMLAYLSGIPRRIGYARDGRGWMLTDRLRPAREGGRFVPIPAIDYYLALAGVLGCRTTERRMTLQVGPADAAAVEAVLADCGVAEGRPLVLIAPGAAYGSAKCYPPELFAAAADRIVAATEATVLLTAAATEGEILGRITNAMARPAVNLAGRLRSLGELKALVARCDVVVTNDSGPRHVAAALGRPLVSIFGPTDPAWARIDHPDETLLRAEADCAPCRHRRCPRDHRCMTRIAPGRVAEAAIERLQRAAKSA